MSPDPAEQTPIDPEDRDYFSYNQASLPWSPWIPFSAGKQEFQQIPKEPGLYRIRPAGKNFLMYIGETKRALYQRLQDLRMELKGRDLMPWSDPHAEAAALWAWQDAEEMEFECSAAPLDATTSARRGMEAYLLYRYRLERNESPLCNFGRFHPRYRKSTSHRENRRGGKLEEGHKDNPAGWPGLEPLPVHGKPGDPDWMDLEWQEFTLLNEENIRNIPGGAGLFLLADTGSNEIVFIGQSADVAGRLIELSRKDQEGRNMTFSYQIIGLSILPHHLRELEADLIGNFYEQYRKVPAFQVRNSW